MRLYKLENGQAVPCEDILEWGTCFERDRHVGLDDVIVPNVDNLVRVSTVFLGIDHSFGTGAPVLYETIVFGHPNYDQLMIRYTTRTKAEAGHAAVVKALKDGDNDKLSELFDNDIIWNFLRKLDIPDEQ